MLVETGAKEVVLMKAISLWQPWASLIALGIKKIETRHWKTNYRGTLLIHATKNIGESVPIVIARLLKEKGVNVNDLPRGALVCMLDLYDCVEIKVDTVMPSFFPEWQLGDFDIGRYMWQTRRVMAFKEPIPFRGRQSLFDVPEEIIENAMPKM